MEDLIFFSMITGNIWLRITIGGEGDRSIAYLSEKQRADAQSFKFHFFLSPVDVLRRT